MSAAEVLNAAADELDCTDTHRADRDLHNGAGGHVFTLLYETAKRLYGWTAIEHLQHHLRGQLPGGHIQQWAETDRHAVAKALREATGQPTLPDLETVALRAKLTEFEHALADATGWHGLDPATLVRETGLELARLRKTVKRLTDELAQERQRAARRLVTPESEATR